MGRCRRWVRKFAHRGKTDDGLTGIFPDVYILHDSLRLDRLLPHFLNRNQGTVGNPIARS